MKLIKKYDIFKENFEFEDAKDIAEVVNNMLMELNFIDWKANCESLYVDYIDDEYKGPWICIYFPDFPSKEWLSPVFMKDDNKSIEQTIDNFDNENVRQILGHIVEFLKSNGWDFGLSREGGSIFNKTVWVEMFFKKF